MTPANVSVSVAYGMSIWKGSYIEVSDTVVAVTCDPFRNNIDLALLLKRCNLLLFPDPVADVEGRYAFARLGKILPNPSLSSQARYMVMASLPRPKNKKMTKPQTTRIHRSKSTWPPVGTLMMLFQSGPCTMSQE